MILTVLWGYALARRERRRTVSTTEGVAVGVVIGLASAIALAFPLQWWLSGVATSAPAKEGGPSDHDVTMATWWSMAVGLAVAVAVAIWIRRSSRRSSAAAEPPAPDPLQRLTDEVVRLREALERHPVPAAAQPAEAVRAAADKVRPRPLLVTLAGEIRRWWQTRNMVL